MSGTLIVNRFHTECGECGYGAGGYMASPALDGKPILMPESTACPSCGVTFTRRMSHYDDVQRILDDAAQARRGP